MSYTVKRTELYHIEGVGEFTREELFELKGAIVESLGDVPDRIVDGDGDVWRLQSDGLYAQLGDEDSWDCHRTFGSIADAYGIRER